MRSKIDTQSEEAEKAVRVWLNSLFTVGPRQPLVSTRCCFIPCTSTIRRSSPASCV